VQNQNYSVIFAASKV